MKKKNFTLVELLCATALVVILAGIGFSAYSYASYRGREASTKSLITRLEAARLETFFGTKVQINPSASTETKGSIVINYYSMDDLTRIQELMENR